VTVNITSEIKRKIVIIVEQTNGEDVSYKEATEGNTLDSGMTELRLSPLYYCHIPLVTPCSMSTIPK
jgi:hypothetical protein